MRKTDSLSECLFRGFANTEYSDPQERSTMWAILEGLMRLKTLDYSWHRVDARKNHECVRGCTIKAGSIYFHWALGAWNWNDERKFCASCMAMILYFKEVHLLPHCSYTHWDFKNKQPVNLSREDP